MINDVSRALTRWLESLTIIRKGVGSYVDGEWINGGDSNVDIKAVIQNANPDDLELLPEGTRTSEAVKLHTVSKVNTVSESSETDADQFVYEGATYRIYDVYARKIGNYYKAVAIRIPS
jgi:hypothetical protein